MNHVEICVIKLLKGRSRKVVPFFMCMVCDNEMSLQII